MKLQTLIFTVVLALFGALVTSVVTGCSQIKASKIADAADDVVSITPVLCETAEYFAAKGVEVPGVENCEKLIQFLDKNEVVAALKIVECAREYKDDSEKLASCAMDAGWPLIRAKLDFLDGTDFEDGGTTVMDMGDSVGEGDEKQ